MTTATNLSESIRRMHPIPRFLVGAWLIVASLGACAGCATEANKGDDIPTTNGLSFTWSEKDDRQVQFVSSLDGCRDGRTGCYHVSDLDLDSEDHTGRSTAGDLTEQQLDALNALVTPEQLEHYEEDQDPTCEEQGELKYTILYEDAEGYSHFYCLLPGDHLSADTEKAIEVMTELAEKLLKEGTPRTDEN